MTLIPNRCAIIFALGMILSASLLCPPLARAETVDAKLIQILKEDWNTKRESKGHADSIYAKLYKSSPTNFDVAYGYLLVKIRQNDIRKAVQANEKVLELDPNHLPSLRSHAWLLLVTRQFHPAIEAIRRYDSAVDEDKTISKEERLSNARVIGRMFGIIQGPFSSRVAETEVRELLRAILTGAAKDVASEFDKAREEVLVKYSEFSIETEAIEDENKVAAQEKKIETLENLKKDEERLKELLEPIPNEIQKIRERQEKELEKIERRAEPLESDLRRTEQRINDARRDLIRITNDINFYENQAANESDRFLRNRWLVRADSLRISARRIDLNNRSLISEARGIRTEMSILDTQYGNTKNRFQTDINGLERQRGAINKQLQRNRVLAIRAQKPKSVPKTRLKSAQLKMESVKTYETFPVELERTKLLKKLTR